jgi:hypothetical protein
VLQLWIISRRFFREQFTEQTLHGVTPAAKPPFDAQPIDALNEVSGQLQCDATPFVWFGLGGAHS